MVAPCCICWPMRMTWSWLHRRGMPYKVLSVLLKMLQAKLACLSILRKLFVWSLIPSTGVNNLHEFPRVLTSWLQAWICRALSISRSYIVDNCLCDDKDINREVKALFTRTNILCRRFKRCSTAVKLKLFRSYCMCFFDASLWCRYNVSAMNKLSSCYIKCLKYFFGFAKYSSVTVMLLELGLPSFNTLLHNCQFSFKCSLSLCENLLVKCWC